jgi:hypothetical protein
MFAYIYYFLFQSISKKGIEHLSACLLQHKSHVKKPLDVKKSLKCVKACCSDPELSVDQRK